MKSWYLLLSAFFYATFLYSQDVDKKIQAIKNSNDYYWGEASSKNLSEAEDLALSKLLEQISVNVYSSFDAIVSESENAISSTASKVIKTYSSAALSNVQTLKILIDNGFLVFRYIEKKEVDKIFVERENIAFEMFNRAQEFLEEGNISSALKYSYYSIILANSIPKQAIVKDGRNLKLQAPIFIKDILNSLKCFVISKKKISEKEIQYNLKFIYKENNISAIDFAYWDGRNQISVFASDGEGVVSLFGESSNFTKLDVFVKYDFYESREEIKEVAELWNFVVKPSFNNKLQADLSEIKNIEKETKSKFVKKIASSNKYSLTIHSNEDKSNFIFDKISVVCLNFIDLIETKSENKIKNYFAKDINLQNKFKYFIKYNNPKILNQSNELILEKAKENWIARGLQIVCFYPSLRKFAKEIINLEFDSKGEMVDFSFGIANAYYENLNLIEKSPEDLENRRTILRFVEKYRTAFLTRDIDFLEKVFSEEALIIVGKITPRKNIENKFVYSELSEKQPSFEQIIYTKKQYLEKQRKNFASLKDIHIGYGGIKVLRKNDIDGVYGLSLRQSYSSTNYSDEGYLFLLIDFRDNLPTIYVRSWQPNEWSEEAMIKLSNFRINK